LGGEEGEGGGFPCGEVEERREGEGGILLSINPTYYTVVLLITL